MIKYKWVLVSAFITALLPGCAVIQKTGEELGIIHKPELQRNTLQKEFDIIPELATT